MRQRPSVRTALSSLILGGLVAGCQTQHRPLVAPLPTPALPASVVELGPCGAARTKTGLFHQPGMSEREMRRLADAALCQMPAAEFLSTHQINAVLGICPSPRWPLFYRLRVEISGLAARTNQAGLK